MVADSEYTKRLMADARQQLGLEPPPKPGIYEMREYEPARCYHLTAWDLAERALGWFCLGTMAGAALMKWMM